MDETIASIKLFAGFPLTKSLHYHWNRSKHLDCPGSSLIEIIHQGVSYIGIGLESDYLLLEQLYQLEVKIKKELEQRCESISLEDCSMHLFGQIFIL